MGKKICIFCGSNTGVKPSYAEMARKLGYLLAQNEHTLVFGGGKVGLMGIVADAVMEKGGKTIGVIPDFLWEREVGHEGLTEIHIVKSMHIRKEMMAEMADAFIAMPGGIGTLEEIAEIFTWNQLHLINAPMGLLNVEGYYDNLIRFMDDMVKNGFLKQESRDRLMAEAAPKALLGWIEKMIF